MKIIIRKQGGRWTYFFIHPLYGIVWQGTAVPDQDFTATCAIIAAVWEFYRAEWGALA